MSKRIIYFLALGLFVASVSSAAIDNSVYTEESTLRSSDELVSSIVDNCWADEPMSCIKEKVLDFMNNMAGLGEESARSFSEADYDQAIFERAARILSTNEFRVELPGNAVITYRADRGLNMEDNDNTETGRGLLKKKLLLPVFLLLKLKMKALMPLIVKIIGLKAIKALILSKIAIKLVLGFLIYNLIQKFGGMKMSMMPMMPQMPVEPPMTAYGPPVSTTTSSYEPNGWDSQGGPYARWDSPSSSSSAHNMAYSSYPSSTYESYKTTSS